MRNAHSKALSAVLALGLFTATSTSSLTAHASDAAAAEALFAEAKRLVAEGKLAEACPKFAESNRLDRGAGTLIHLADCYEKSKQIASAWATYTDAASAAQALGRADWQKLAAQKASALEPKLAKLTIKVDAPVEKITVTRDGAELSQASWGLGLPIDAGAHTIEASAPGHKPFKTNVTIAKDGERSEVVIPKLDPLPKDAPASADAISPGASGPAAAGADTTPASTGSTQRTVGFIVGGVGIAGVALGAVTGLMAIGKSNDAKSECPNEGACGSQAAVDASESAKSLGLVATIGFIAGGAALATGAVLVFTAGPSKPDARAAKAAGWHLAPQAGKDSAGFLVTGSF